MTTSTATAGQPTSEATPATAAERTTGTTRHQPVRIAVIVGSIRADRFGTVPANWIHDQARKRDDIEVDLIDLADYDCPAVLGGNDPNAPLPEQVKKLSERVEKADGFVVVTPVYNRSYPAALKNAIDWLYSEWQLKPVGLVSYGGISGGLTSAEALRAVFVEFEAVTLRDAIMLPNAWNAFDHDGRPVRGEALAKVADSFLSQLTWWAQTLKQARAERPYPFSESA